LNVRKRAAPARRLIVAMTIMVVVVMIIMMMIVMPVTVIGGRIGRRHNDCGFGGATGDDKHGA